MKSIALRICNVGPFRDEYIDFEALGDMFLITGKTGSGKTTIFDCMTYALYGRFPGSRSDIAKEMRSKFASSAEASFVDFTFSINGDVFRVNRTLPSEKKSAKVVLSHKEATGAWKDNAATKTKEIDRIIKENLIHLEMNEFNRIIMLPQGEFAAFLKQNSTERSETLSKLFPVQKYSALKEKLKEKCDSYKAKLQAYEMQKNAFGEFDVQQENEKIEEIKKAISIQASEIKEVEGKRDKTLSEIKEVEGESLKAKKLFELENKKKTLLANKEKMGDVQKKIEKAEEALSVIEFVTSKENADSRKCDATGKCALYQENLSLANDKLSELEKDKDIIEQKRKEQTDYDLKINDLERKKDAIELFNVTKKDFEKIEKKKNEAKNLCDKFLEKKNEYEKYLASISEKWNMSGEGELSSFLSLSFEKNINSTENTLNSLAEQKENAEKGLGHSEEIKKFSLQKEEILSDVQKTQKAILVTEDLISSLEEQKKKAIQSDMAYHLSLFLVKDKPCPVCGSTEHPSPAICTTSFSAEEELDAQRLNLENAKEKLGSLNADCAAKDVELKTKDEMLSSILNLLSLSKAEELFSFIEKTDSLIQEDETRLSLLKEDRKNVSEVSLKLNKVQKEYSSGYEEYLETEKEVASLESVLREREDACNGSFDSKEIEAELEHLKEAKQAEKVLIEKWDSSYSDFKMQKSKAEGSLASSKEELEVASVELEKARRLCSEKISLSPFSDESGVKAAFIEKGEMQKLKQEVSAWQNALNETETLIKENECQKDFNELSALLSKLKDEEVELSKKKDSILEEKNKNEVLKGTLEKKIQDYININSEYNKLLEEAEPYKWLWDDIAGNGDKKTSIDTWVLALYFSEILDRANPKLSSLSSGRYQFRIETDGKKGRGKKGLDFVVEDSYTGQDRPPQTLSGGETFEASISMALALTEVVQNRSGGIKLESLFIDEGFGTLDEEALKKAIEVLRQIQENRTVGVISHVGEMESEIHSKLFVKKERTGSAIWVNGVHSAVPNW